MNKKRCLEQQKVACVALPRKMIWRIWIVRSEGWHRQEAHIFAIRQNKFALLSFLQQTIYPRWTSYHPFGAVLMLGSAEPLKVEHLTFNPVEYYTLSSLTALTPKNPGFCGVTTANVNYRRI